MDTLLSGLARELSAVEHEPSFVGVVILHFPVVNLDDARCRLSVTEIECEGVDAGTEVAGVETSSASDKKILFAI